jgi:hypothetical protein
MREARQPVGLARNIVRSAGFPCPRPHSRLRSSDHSPLRPAPI